MKKVCSSQKYFVLFWCTCVFLNSAIAASANNALIEWKNIHQPIKSDGGMVSTQEYRASEIGARILAAGGNAVDAAVAIGFVEAVTLPKAGNLGGGGFMLVHLAKLNKTVAIDYREIAPELASHDMFLNDKGEVETSKSRFSVLASGVPGTVAGLLEALDKYGTMSRQEVLMPAFELAKNGIRADFPFLDSLNARAKRLQTDPETKRIYFKPDGTSYQPGDLIKFPDLANTLSLIMRHGREGFYQGEVANRLVEFMKTNDGLLTLNDLKNYQVKEHAAITGTYRGYQVVSMPPPSSGGVHVVQALNMLESFDVSSMGWGSANHIHYMTEAFRRIYADRSKHLGDPAFHDVPMTQIMAKDYAKTLTKNISKNKASLSTDIAPAAFEIKESPQTTHYSVVDQWGNVVSNTYTLNFSFGSGKIAPGTGFFLNNEMDDFSAKPGVPNAYGLIGGEANAVQAGKRPLSSMTPTILFKNREPVLVTGSPGGSRIITAVLHQIVNFVDFNMNVADASASPRFHHQWFPDTLFIENGFSPDTLNILQQRGHTLRSSNAFGSVQSISVKNGLVTGASDPRRAGAKSIGVMKSGELIYQ